MFFTAAYWKRKARAALKGHWLNALLIALAVSLPSLLVQGIATFTGNDLLTRLQQLIYGSMTTAGTLEEEALRTGLEELKNASSVWMMLGFRAAAWLLSPCLTLGMYHWMTQRLRGEEDTGVTAVFSRISLFFKAIGLRLWITLKILLYMLPGMALSFASLLPLLLADKSSRIAVLSSANTAMSLSSVSGIVMTVLGVIAILRYGLSDILMANQPELKIREAAKRSKELMKGKQTTLLFLYISFALWYLAELLVVNMTAGMMGGILTLMVEMLASLALQVYVYTSVCAFCRTLLQEEAGEAPVPPEQQEEI